MNATAPISPALHSRQLELEAMSRSMGVNRFLENIRRRQNTKQESTTPYGRSLLRQALSPLASAIQTFVDETKNGKPGRRALAAIHLEGMDPEVVAFLAARTIMDLLATLPAHISPLAQRVGTAVETEARLAYFEEKEPALFHTIGKTSAHLPEKRRRDIFSAAMGEAVEGWTPWGRATASHVGLKLIELMEAHTGFIRIFRTMGAKGPVVQVAPTDLVLSFVGDVIEKTQHLSPQFLPMVIPPLPWKDSTSGGYISANIPPQPLVRTRHLGYLKRLDREIALMEPVLDAVNKVQSVGWRINKRVLEVALTLWEGKQAVAGLPMREALPVPVCPAPKGFKRSELEGQVKEDFDHWRRKAHEVHTINNKIMGRGLLSARVLALASQFKNDEVIYFPHNLDFRGRIYSIPTLLTPQGNDLSKGLLMFSEGKPLHGGLPLGEETGPGWLAIHGANTFGYDKQSLTARIDWVDQHHAEIMACAEDPMGNLWWTEAGSPFQFLAFCFEWAGYMREGAAFVSHLPIALDGSCSGLQHFSAALRDAVGGKAVNLLPSDVPSDVYAEVAKVAYAKIKREFSPDKAAMVHKALSIGIDRGTAKRTTMTLPYGATRHAATEFVKDWLAEKIEADPGLAVFVGDAKEKHQLADFIAGYIWEAIGEVVIAARAAMGWLREVAWMVAKGGKPVEWTTLDGLPVVQRYNKQVLKQIKARIGGGLIYIATLEETRDPDTRRHANGIAPNWVHSLDATHLRLAVLYADDMGVSSLAVIHDSFGTHASDTDKLAACLRESMVDIYKNNDVLANFLRDVGPNLPTSAKVPPMPATGSLDLEEIKESQYVFA